MANHVRSGPHEENDFLIIPEIKRLEPSLGSLCKRYNVSKLTEQIILELPPALGVNYDGVPGTVW